MSIEHLYLSSAYHMIARSSDSIQSPRKKPAALLLAGPEALFHDQRVLRNTTPRLFARCSKCECHREGLGVAQMLVQER